MKTANTFKSSVIVATALVAAVFVSGCAFHAGTQQVTGSDVQTVTMTAKRMTTDEKIAFDTAAATAQTVVVAAKRMTEDEKIAFDTATAGTQTVVIAAKRLTAEQKLAMLQQDLRIQASAVQRNQPAA